MVLIRWEPQRLKKKEELKKIVERVDCEEAQQSFYVLFYWFSLRLWHILLLPWQCQFIPQVNAEFCFGLRVYQICGSSCVQPHQYATIAYNNERKIYDFQHILKEILQDGIHSRLFEFEYMVRNPEERDIMKKSFGCWSIDKSNQSIERVLESVVGALQEISSNELQCSPESCYSVQVRSGQRGKSTQNQHK